MYEITNLFLYKIVFIIELMVSEFLFSRVLIKRENYAVRMIISIAINLFVSISIPIISYDGIFLSIMFLVMYLSTLLTLMIPYEDKFINILFVSIAGYGMQHLAYGVNDLLYGFLTNYNISSGIYTSDVFDFSELDFAFILKIIIYAVSYSSVYSITTMLTAPRFVENKIALENATFFFLVIIILFVDIFLNAFVVYFTSDLNMIQAGSYIKRTLAIYDILSCALALFIQFELTLRKNLENELDILHSIRYKEKKQYEDLKSNMELVNLKCHDMKHQISSIGEKNKLSDEYINEINDVINVYDSDTVSGSDALDVILTEYSFKCRQNNIHFTIMADGVALSYMKDMDIYSLFGNMMENAFDAVKNLDENKRVIGLKIYADNLKTNIVLYNCFDSNINFENGIPVTTKGSSHYHGYGMKSIKYIVEKYNGDMVVSVHEHIFEISIAFPKIS